LMGGRWTMTHEEAIRTLKKGGPLVTLAEAIGTVASEPGSSLEDLLLGLQYEGLVAEQAALALYKRTGRALPEDRSFLATRAQEWTGWLARAPAQSSDAAEAPLDREQLCKWLELPSEGLDDYVQVASYVAVGIASEKLRSASSRARGTTFDRTAPRRGRKRALKGLTDYLERGLSREERLILVLYYFEGLSFDEIAQVLGLPEARVRQIHQEVLARLRGRFGSDAAPQATAG